MRRRSGATDAGEHFTIQSVSKPFVYALALDEFGLDDVMRRVGVEPSGEAFNAIRLEPETGRPPNPMVNAGAILTTSPLPFGRVGDAHPAALRMLDRLALSLAEDSAVTMVVDRRRRGLLRNAETEFSSLDEAVRYLEPG